jgi:hypothetical protein
MASTQGDVTGAREDEPADPGDEPLPRRSHAELMKCAGQPVNGRSGRT